MFMYACVGGCVKYPVFNEILKCRCLLMLLVTHSAMQLRSVSAWCCLHTTIPSILTAGGSGGVENRGKMEKKNPNVENSEMSWITSLLINDLSAHQGTLSCNDQALHY